MLLIISIVALPLLLVLAVAAGCQIVPRGFESWSEAIAIRAAAGLLVFATLLFVLGMSGMLRPLAIATLVAVVVVFALARRATSPAIVKEEQWLLLLLTAVTIPFAMLAAYPATAFDETLYHLPTVRRFAASGALPILPDLRMPVFPQLQEVLQVPLLLAGGGPATHALPLAAMIIVTLLLFDVCRRLSSLPAPSMIAPALFLGAPLTTLLATSGYVEMLMAAFVLAALSCTERCRRSDALQWPLLTGAFCGAAASIKYLGLFWVAAVMVVLIAMSSPNRRWVNLAAASITCCAVLLPWYARIVYETGNPLFPFAPSIFGASVWTFELEKTRSLPSHLWSFLTIPWDALFRRSSIGWQPPISPWFVLALPFLFFLKIRFERLLAASALAFVLFWTWLPRDVRYLLPVIALLGTLSTIGLIRFAAEWRFEAYSPRARRLGFVVLLVALTLPGPAYAVWRMAQQGPIPRNEGEAAAFLRKQIPEMRGIEAVNASVSRNERTFLCGRAELLDYFTGEVSGDFTGVARYDRFTDATTPRELAKQMADADLDLIAVMKVNCLVAASALEPDPRFFTIVYSDAFVQIARRTK